MKVIGLVSGGKDSTFALIEAIRNLGHELECLGHIAAPSAPWPTHNKLTGTWELKGPAPSQQQQPDPAAQKDDQEDQEGQHMEEDSWMYQSVGSELVPLLALTFNKPLYIITNHQQHTSHHRHHRVGGSVKTDDDQESDDSMKKEEESSSLSRTEMTAESDPEVMRLMWLLKYVLTRHPEIRGVVSGAIASTYQRQRIEFVCRSLGLTSLSPLWQREQSSLLEEMVGPPTANVEAILVKVCSIGLDRRHLGKSLVSLQPLLERLRHEYGVNVCGEGGEYESFTVDSVLFPRFRLAIPPPPHHTNTDRRSVSRIVMHSDQAFSEVCYLAFNTSQCILVDKAPPSSEYRVSWRIEDAIVSPTTANIDSGTASPAAVPVAVAIPRLIPASGSKDDDGDGEEVSGCSVTYLKISENATTTVTAPSPSPLLSPSPSPSSWLISSGASASSGGPFYVSTASALWSSLSFTGVKVGDASGSPHPEDLLMDMLLGCETTGECVTLSLKLIADRIASMFPSPSDTVTPPHHLQSTALHKLRDIFLIHVYLRDMGDFVEMNTAYRRFFEPIMNPPARAAISLTSSSSHHSIASFSSSPLVQHLPRVIIEIWGYHQPTPSASPPLIPLPVTPRDVLHVESISRWAPACIGPYAQVHSVDKAVDFMAGQIALDAPRMVIRDTIQSDALRQLDLCWRHICSIVAARQQILGGHDALLTHSRASSSTIPLLYGTLFISHDVDPTTSIIPYLGTKSSVTGASSALHFVPIVRVGTLPRGALVELVVSVGKQWKRIESGSGVGGDDSSAAATTERDNAGFGMPPRRNILFSDFGKDEDDSNDDDNKEDGHDQQASCHVITQSTRVFPRLSISGWDVMTHSTLEVDTQDIRYTVERFNDYYNDHQHDAANSAPSPSASLTSSCRHVGWASCRAFVKFNNNAHDSNTSSAAMDPTTLPHFVDNLTHDQVIPQLIQQLSEYGELLGGDDDGTTRQRLQLCPTLLSAQVFCVPSAAATTTTTTNTHPTVTTTPISFYPVSGIWFKTDVHSEHTPGASVITWLFDVSLSTLSERNL